MVELETQKIPITKLYANMDSVLPNVLQVGKGTVLYIWGWCFSLHRCIQNLEILLDGRSFPIQKWGYPRWDVQNSLYPQLQGDHFNIIRSGFFASIELHEVRQPGHQEVVLKATFDNGESAVKRIGSLVLLQKQSLLLPDLHALPLDLNQPSIAICMATYSPPIDLFKKQIDSIRSQTFQNWICLISDDGSDEYTRMQIESVLNEDRRFLFFPSADRLGFYYNFERVLSLVPAGIQYVALADQDDNWHPDKLETLLAQFEPGINLVYSDMNIVDEEGKLLQSTYWLLRPNRYDNLTSLLLANTITGAASLFRRELLDDALPFPQNIGDCFHDHWLGCLALATGTIKFVDRSLYDYVQHRRNVLGWYNPDKSEDMGVSAWTKLIRDPLSRAKFLNHANMIYFYDFFRIQNIARALILRAGERIPAAKSQAIRQVMLADQSIGLMVRLALRGWRPFGGKSETIGAESRLFKGLVWRQYWDYKDRHLPALPSAFDGGGVNSLDSILEKSKVSSAEVSRLAEFERKISPFKLHITRQVDKRVNLLIPTIDLDYVFGGYITKFNLARRLAETGYKVRIVIVDYCDFRPGVWRDKFKGFQGLENLLDQVEIAYAFDRRKPLVVNPQDVFIATTWWTAHIAHQAVKDLGQERFLYLIQEYEPYTFPMGSYAALADETYTFPHYAVFSTELLREFFALNHLGVYAAGQEAGDRLSLDFRNTITRVEKATRQRFEQRASRRLLFYARPETHAARNMYEIGMLALGRAIEEGIFDDCWQFYGIGTVEKASRIPLKGGKELFLMPRQSQEEYARTLCDYDLGLALMFTPHPSLVPIEMASAGMLVVTNSFLNKTSSAMASISQNILTCRPAVDDIVKGLSQAVAQVGDFDSRLLNSNVDWPTDWDAAFNPTFMKKMGNFLGSAAEDLP